MNEYFRTIKPKNIFNNVTGIRNKVAVKLLRLAFKASPHISVIYNVTFTESTISRREPEHNDTFVIIKNNFEWGSPGLRL